MSEEVNEIEEKAKAMGWVPEEEFKGDPERWVDAETFVERGENVLPILRERLDKSYDKISNLESEIQEVKKAATNIAEYNTKVEKVAHERAKKEYEKELNAIKSKMKKAVKDGDEETFSDLEAELDSLEKPEEPAPAPEKAQELPEWFDEWKNDNRWFDTDPEMQATAVAYDNNPKWESELSGKARADAVAKKIKELYPQKFTNPNRDTPPTVDAGGDKDDSASKGKKTFNDLPADAKAAFKSLKEDFERMGKKFTKEDYLKNYEWEKE